MKAKKKNWSPPQASRFKATGGLMRVMGQRRATVPGAIAVISILFGLVAAALAQAPVAPVSLAQARLSLAPVVAVVAPAVVDIQTVGATPGRSVYFPGRPPG